MRWRNKHTVICVDQWNDNVFDHVWQMNDLLQWSQESAAVCLSIVRSSAPVMIVMERATSVHVCLLSIYYVLQCMYSVGMLHQSMITSLMCTSC